MVVISEAILDCPEESCRHLVHSIGAVGISDAAGDEGWQSRDRKAKMWRTRIRQMMISGILREITLLVVIPCFI